MLCSPSTLWKLARAASACLVLFTSLGIFSLGSDKFKIQFVDVTREAGIDWTHENGATSEKYLLETMGAGGAFLDFNNDGWLDIYLVNSGSHRHSRDHSPAGNALYQNNGDGTFTDVTGKAGVEGDGYGMGVAVGDINNDGWDDIYVTQFGPNILYLNEKDGTFRDVTEQAGVGGNAWSTSAAFFDMENDGDLDLFVGIYMDWDYDKEVFCGQEREGYRSYCHPDLFEPIASVLYRNEGDGTFTDVTQSARVDVPGKALGVVTGDTNGDGFVDIYVANDAVANFLFKNTGNGTFEEIGLIAGVANGIYGKAESGMGTDFGDFNGDGRIDLIVTNIDQEMNNLFANLGEDWFMDLTLAAGLGQVAIPYSGFGVRFLDYDNDGDLDLVVLNGHVLDDIHLYRADVVYAQPPLLLENAGDGKFSDAGKEAGKIWRKPMVGRALATGDYDNDGDWDLLFVNNGQHPVLLRNDGGNRNPWLGVELVGTRSNHNGIGVVLILTTNQRKVLRELHGGSSYQAAHDRRLLFGLGEEEEIRALEIHWPSGVVQRLKPLQVRRYHAIREPEEQ